MINSRAIPISEIIYYSEEDIKMWKNKILLNKWKQQYPNLIQNHLFNQLSKRSVLNAYCFGELFTGIQYVKKGYKFLYEPWIENFLLVKAKQNDLKELQNKFIDIFIKHAGCEVCKFIQNKIARKINKGQPDLFIYNKTNCFFVEVKRKGDIIRKEQEIFVHSLDKSNFDLPIKIISLQLSL